MERGYGIAGFDECEAELLAICSKNLDDIQEALLTSFRQYSE